MDSSGPENPDQTITWSYDSSQNPGPVRSYRCTFCNRGFSTAQALGGHMNIHRKDRAKLREFSHENALSLDITRGMDSSLESYETGKAGSEDKLDGFFQEIGNPDKAMGSLALFSEAPSGRHFEKALKKSRVGEIDLELRLGSSHEP